MARRTMCAWWMTPGLAQPWASMGPCCRRHPCRPSDFLGSAPDRSSSKERRSGRSRANSWHGWGAVVVSSSLVEAASGRVLIGSLASAGEMVVGEARTEPVGGPVVPILGPVDVIGGSNVTATGIGSGPVVIRAGRVTVADSLIQAAGFGVAASGGIALALSGDLTVRGGVIGAGGFGTGAVGPISLSAGPIEARERGSIDNTVSL